MGGLVSEQLVEFSVVFPDDERKEPVEYLRGISRDFILKAGAFFLGFKNQNSKFQGYRELLKMMFQKENQAFANDVYKCLKAMETEVGRIRIVNPISSLLLFELAFQYLTDEQTQTEAEAEISVFKAYLAINNQVTKKESTAISSTKDLPEGIYLAGLLFAQSYPFSDLINYKWNELIICQMLRAYHLFNFLDGREDTKALLKEFLDYYAVDSWREYFKLLWSFLLSPINNNIEKEGFIDIVVEKNDDFEKGCKFIEKLSLHDDTEIGDFDFKILRSFPFYKADEGVYRIIYPLFGLEKIFKGLYFKLAEINRNLPAEYVKNNFRSFYCDEFSERHLLYAVLNDIYKNRHIIKFSGEEIKKNTNTRIDSEPDYYMRNGNKVFLFESKDILIPAEIKQSMDFAQYEKEFKKRLYFKESNGKKKNGAVLQLINNVRRLLKKELSFDTNYKPKSLQVYPILVLHDNQYNTIGLNTIIRYWFDAELKKLETEGLPVQQRVRSLTIIDIDTFICYQGLLRDRVYKLEDLIKGYFKFISFDKKRKYKDENHAKERKKETFLPFSHYVGKTCEEKWQMPKAWKEIGSDIFKFDQ